MSLRLKDVARVLGGKNRAVLIMTSNRAEAEAAYGEIRQQAGITHDVMRAAVCATGTPL